MVQRCVSDAKEVDIEVPVRLAIGGTTVAEAGGRLEQSCAGLVPNTQMECDVLTSSLKITGKSNLGRSIYRYKLSDFWVSSCKESSSVTACRDRGWSYRMDRGHLSEGQVV